MKDVIVIGAGPAGLAVGACLKAEGFAPHLIEREATVGSAWRRHYDRLALHTDKRRSSLPHHPLPASAPRYVPRAEVVAYLEDYARHFALDPELGVEVQQVMRTGNHWQVETSAGPRSAQAVVLATGMADRPKRPSWPGLESFPGPVLHARAYRRPADLPGARVLVVGFGNSGGELAIDLVEDGRDVEIAVRSPVNLLPKELFGQPIGNFEILQKLLPYKWADAVNAPILRWKLGDYEQYGLRKASKGPIAQVREDGRVPLIDLGTLALMREGRLRARPGLARIDGEEVTFTDGTTGRYDAILLATGYVVDLRPLLGDLPGLDAQGFPRVSGAALADGLWTLAYHTVPNGQLRAIAQQAPTVAAEVAAYVAGARTPA